MTDEDHVFCLMFDEISIIENLCFIHKFSCMEGFVDLRNHGRTSNIAHHALVFMLHGLYNKWKQPVAYYLMDRGTKGEMLADFLMEVLDTSHNEVLEVDCCYVWHGCQQCHLGVSDQNTFCQVSESINCSYI